MFCKDSVCVVRWTRGSHNRRGLDMRPVAVPSQRKNIPKTSKNGIKIRVIIRSKPDDVVQGRRPVLDDRSPLRCRANFSCTRATHPRAAKVYAASCGAPAVEDERRPPSSRRPDDAAQIDDPDFETKNGEVQAQFAADERIADLGRKVHVTQRPDPRPHAAATQNTPTSR